MIKKLLYFLLLFSIEANGVRYVRFDRYTVTDGLTSNLVHYLEQDSSGHLWIATDCGLSRYDGNSFKQYTRSLNPTLLRNEIFNLKTFEDKSFYLGGELGVLLRYDPVSDTFVDMAPSDFAESYNKQVDGFTVDRKGNKLVYTSNGFYFYDKQSDAFSSNFPAYDSARDFYILSLYEDAFDRYWIGSFNSLRIMDKKGNLLKSFDLAQGVGPMFSAKITPVSDKKVFVTLFSNVIYSFSISDRGDIQDPQMLNLPFSNINNILRDSKGHYWYTTDGEGLWYSEEEPSATTHYDKVMPTVGESVEKIYCIKEARNGDLWIGTHSAGLMRCNTNNQQSVLFSTDMRFPLKMASSFSSDEKGNIYVSCDGGGLAKVSSDYSSVECYDERNGLKNRNVVAHAVDSVGHLWLATWGGGVMEFDPKTKYCRQEKFAGLNTNLSCFSYIAIMNNGEIWVSSGGDGIYMRNTKGKWNRILLQFGENEFDMWPFRVIEGKDGVRWIATSRSLWRWTEKESVPLLEDFSKVKDHNPMHLSDLVMAKDGSVYVATDRNVLHFSADASLCDTVHSLPKGNYSSLCFESENCLVTSGTNGIWKLDVLNGEAKKYPYDFQRKGLNYFRGHSSGVLSDGRIVLGTKEGFLLLSSSSSESNNHVEHFQISDIAIDNLSYGEQQPYLKRDSEGVLRSVELPYNLSNIRLTVDLVEYGDQELDLYYQLEGFSDRWVPLSKDRIIEFTYIPSGTYKLNVRVDKQKDALQMITLDLRILAPWWTQWWFILGCFLLLVLLISGYFYLHLRRMKLQKIELEKMVNARTKELGEKNILIEEQNEQLKQVITDKDRVLSVLAHDLKNPMFAIVGALEGWLRRESSLSAEEKRGIISQVLASSQTLQTEMGRLLEWARAKKQDIDFTPSPVDLDSTLRNVVSLLQPLLEKKNIDFTIEEDLKHCLWGDSRMISTVLRNFINNAVKFTPEGGRITVGMKEQGSSIEIDIKDNGVGMTPSQLADLQSQGYCQSTLGTSNEKGTGLGFRICQDYVKKNSGTMTISSEEGKGTVIHLTFPISEQIVEHKPANIEKDKKVLEQNIDRTMLEGNVVVVVDDDALIRDNISAILSEYMEVLTASNGEEALSLVHSREVDFVLSDVEMPVMNGIELSRSMAHDDRTNTIPFLFLSAKNEQSDRLLGLLSGAIDYISKPFSASELLMKVNNILRLRQMQQIRLLQQYYADQMPIKVSSDDAKDEESPQEKTNPFVAKLMECLETHYMDSAFSIEQLAEKMNVSQSTLSRRVKSMLNKTPVELLIEHRMNKAYKLLKEKDSSTNVADIAYEVGFSEPAYFTKKFKDFFGCLPSSIR